jgi:arsenical-resistance protein 2
MTETQAPQPDQWWAAFPAPKAKCPEITADEVMKMFDDMDIKPGPREFLLVDVRRTDWEVSKVKLWGNWLFYSGHIYSSSISWT